RAALRVVETQQERKHRRLAGSRRADERDPLALGDAQREVFERKGSGPRGIGERHGIEFEDRKSTRLNSSHVESSYAVFCLKTKSRLRNHHTCSRRTVIRGSAALSMASLRDMRQCSQSCLLSRPSTVVKYASGSMAGSQYAF